MYVQNFPKILSIADEMKSIGTKHNATSGQVALAWLLAQGNDIIPIPGTKSTKVRTVFFIHVNEFSSDDARFHSTLLRISTLSRSPSPLPKFSKSARQLILRTWWRGIVTHPEWWRISSPIRLSCRSCRYSPFTNMSGDGFKPIRKYIPKRISGEILPMVRDNRTGTCLEHSGKLISRGFLGLGYSNSPVRPCTTNAIRS